MDPIFDPLTNPDPNNNPSSQPLSTHCYDLTTLQDLSYRGSWQSITEKITVARQQSLLQKPHEHLIYLTYYVLALTKLRRYSDAMVELDSLNDFESDKYKYDTYTGEYMDGRKGSMVPFALRWLHAEVPGKLGRKLETLDRLYLLLGYTRGKMEVGGMEGTNGTERLKMWRKREVFVIHTISTHHLMNNEFNICLKLLNELVNGNEEVVDDPYLLSKLGYIQMQLGDVEGAKVMFSNVEEVIKKKGLDEVDGVVEFRNLVNRNKAMVYLVGKDYVSAVRKYEECMERDPTDVVAVNNKALCLMYSRDLSDSIKVLESALERVPTHALNETVVVNLCSMYELAYVNHSDIKKTLSNWIVRVAPDDFDSSSTRA